MHMAFIYHNFEVLQQTHQSSHSAWLLWRTFPHRLHINAELGKLFGATYLANGFTVQCLEINVMDFLRKFVSLTYTPRYAAIESVQDKTSTSLLERLMMTFIRQWRQKTHSYKKQNGQKTDRLTKATVAKRQLD